MKTKSALFISILNKQNKLRELFFPARLSTDLNYQKASESLPEGNVEHLVVWGEQRQNPVTYVHVRYSHAHDHKRFCVLLQLADIDIKQIAQSGEIKYVSHMYVDSG